MQFFDELDESVMSLNAVERDLEEAIEAEDYALAARLKAQVDEAVKRDVVGQVLEDLDTALKEER